MTVYERLQTMGEPEYADFQAKLTPGIGREQFIGIRVPKLRKFAKEYYKEEETQEFLRKLPHSSYDENMLHGLLIEQIKDFELCIQAIDAFLPYVDNWAVCDIMSPKVLGKNKEALILHINRWIASPELYTCRFGIEMLMSYYLDESFKKDYLELPASVETEEYYLQMMIAWFFATALAKQWESTISYIENRRLSKWIHNKTIQKAIESRRITEEQKEYLRSLRWK